MGRPAEHLIVLPDYFRWNNEVKTIDQFVKQELRLYANFLTGVAQLYPPLSVESLRIIHEPRIPRSFLPWHYDVRLPFLELPFDVTTSFAKKDVVQTAASTEKDAADNRSDVVYGMSHVLEVIRLAFQKGIVWGSALKHPKKNIYTCYAGMNNGQAYLSMDPDHASLSIGWSQYDLSTKRKKNKKYTSLGAEVRISNQFDNGDKYPNRVTMDFSVEKHSWAEFGRDLLIFEPRKSEQLFSKYLKPNQRHLEVAQGPNSQFVRDVQSLFLHDFGADHLLAATSIANPRYSTL